jgi:hypothetical protein
MPPPDNTTSSMNAASVINPSRAGQTPTEVAYYEARRQYDVAKGYSDLANELETEATEAKERATADAWRRLHLQDKSTWYSNLAENEPDGSILRAALITQAQVFEAEVQETAKSAVRQDNLSEALSAIAVTYEWYSVTGDGEGSVPFLDAEKSLHNAGRAWAEEQPWKFPAEENKNTAQVCL